MLDAALDVRQLVHVMAKAAMMAFATMLLSDEELEAEAAKA